MRQIAILTALIAIIFTSFQSDARSAILMAHYGSSDDSTRAKTINLITSEAAKAFREYEVRECYISSVVRRSLTARGSQADSPQEALLKLRAEGYDSVYVQPTTLIDGGETAEVRAVCKDMARFFSKLVCGNPLCYSPEDCLEVTAILAEEPVATDEVIVYAGHGNMLSSTAMYSQLDYMLEVTGHPGIFVSTIEGYPTAETTLYKLKKIGRKVNRVKIVPLLLVCGNHTKKDIAGEFAKTFSDAEYETEVLMRGLGEVSAIRALYISRLMALISKN